jgi:hypothetical protein
MTHLQFYEMETTPWRALPFVVQELDVATSIRNNFEMIFASLFRPFYFDPNQGRNLLLRGKLAEAASALVEAQDLARDQRKRRAASKNLDFQVRKALIEMEKAHGALLQQGLTEREAVAGLDSLWKDNAEGFRTLLEGNAAEELDPLLAYHLALCKLEEAERQEDRLKKYKQDKVAVRPVDEKVRNDAWMNALGKWKAFYESFSSHPWAPVARLHLARCYAMSGDAASARPLLEDMSGDLTDLEKLARRDALKKK